MKRRLLTLSICLMMAMLSFAHDFEVAHFYYKITSSTEPYTVAVTYKGDAPGQYGNPYGGNVIIPESVSYNGKTYSVTTIEQYAFYGSHITSVTIPNSVTTIEQKAFSGSNGLTSVVIPNSVTTIEQYAFSECSGLTSVTIPNSVTSIEAHAFSNCKALTSVTIPISVTTIEEYTFASCYGLTSVVIPNSVTTIGNSAFYSCSNLTSVVIPNSVTTIGSNAFRSCYDLTSITIGNSVTSIGDYACSFCTALTEIKSYIQKPFATSSNCWNNVDKSIPLYVPYGTKEKYQNTDGWKEFTNIIEMDEAAGIETIENTSSAIDNVQLAKGIFTLTGAKVSDDTADLKSLPRGTYIVNGKKVVIK